MSTVTDDKNTGVLLRRLQDLDLQLDGLEQQAGAVPQKLAQWKDLIQAREIDKAMFARQREDLLLKQRKFEADIAEKQEIRAKYNQQLSLIKTNREYRALLEELDGVNNEIRNIEDIVLGAMTDMEAVDAELAKQDEAIVAVRAQMAENMPRLEQELAQLQGQITEIRAERDGIAADVEPRILTRYDRVRQRRGGAAIARLDAAHGVCGGCHMSLRMQEINEIMGGTLVACGSCGRLLYHDDEPEDAEQAAESSTTA